jgi:hypothetical protein
MSTVAFPGVFQTEYGKRSAKSIPSLSLGNPELKSADLTIHRITETHHGRTLLALGHAAEYLANSRRYSIGADGDEAHEEAIHLLMTASRSVFEDFAQHSALSRRVGDWAIERVVRLLS